MVGETKLSAKLLRLKQKRLRRKQRRKELKKELRKAEKEVMENLKKRQAAEAAAEVQVSYVSDHKIQNNELAIEFVDTFDAFMSAEMLTMDPEKRAMLEAQQEAQERLLAPEPKHEETVKDNEMEIDEKKPLSNKQKKKLHRLKIAELKRLVDRPEIVEEHDCNAADPRLLIFLKGVRNTVPVPVHWCDTKKYLQGKRGFEKPPFELPPFIAATGITQIRDKQLQLGADAKAKAKARGRTRPKRGSLGIDYQVLHDAFFRHQTKPKNMTTFGDCYYEGKEFEQKFLKFKPGVITDHLKKALNMQCRYRVVAQQGVPVQTLNEDGEWRDVTHLSYNTLVDWEDDNKDGDRIKISHPAKGWILKKHKQTGQPLLQRLNVDSPPPWLISMQRFGPPPAYPEVQIPGLNAPIPPWCKYGFADGQWGKPPVDRTGRPLYGDPFGIWQPEEVYQAMMQHDVTLWGSVEDIESSDDEAESSEEDEDDTTATVTGDGISDQTSTLDGVISTSTGGPGVSSVTSSLSGLDSVTSGVQSNFKIRKAGTGTETPESVDPSKAQLYVELEKQKAAAQGIFPSQHTYKSQKRGRDAGGVQIAFNPEDIAGMDESVLRSKYEAEKRRTMGGGDDGRRKKKSRFGSSRDEYDMRF